MRLVIYFYIYLYSDVTGSEFDPLLVVFQPRSTWDCFLNCPVMFLTVGRGRRATFLRTGEGHRSDKSFEHV
jgi:hypothetical protein